MRTTPTRAELEATTDGVFHVMTGCFSYFVWWTSVRPVLEQAQLPNRDLVIALMSNTIIEGTLLAIRKMNDFFRPAASGNEKKDDVFSFDFPGFNGAANFLQPDDFAEVHKRVGHITLREIRHGKVTWEMHRAVIGAAMKYLEFAQFLQTDFFVTNGQAILNVAKSEAVIREFVLRMERAKKMEEGNLSVE